MRRAAFRSALVMLFGVACATPAQVPSDTSCSTLEVQDGETFAQLGPRHPESGPLCLRYHRARAEVSWGISPRTKTALFKITTRALELRVDGKLVGAWYGPCDAQSGLRSEVSTEATHYMVRHLALRRLSSVQVRVGAGVSSVDLMFALETLNDFGHAVYLHPQPLTEVPACTAKAVREVQLGQEASAAQPRVEPALLDAVVSPRLPLLQSCFRRTVRPLACSSLVRRIDLTVDRHGMISKAAVADHTFGAPAVDACVGAAVWDLVFPAPADGQPAQGSLRFQNCEDPKGASPMLDFSQ